MPDQNSPDPQQPQAKLTLEQKLARAQADQKLWTALAAKPNLSPGAAEAARQAARSSAAAVKLCQKALVWRDDPEKADREHQLSLRSLNIPLPEAFQPGPKS